jgi:hypothetical protein
MATEQFSNRMQERRISDGERMSLVSRCCQATEESIQQNPMLMTVAAFGVGVGLGALVGCRLAEPDATSRRHAAEALGRRMLDSIAEVLPEPVRRYVG